VAGNHYNDGRKAAISAINDYAKQGLSRQEAANSLFRLSDGEFNTSEAQCQFDAGVRAQLNDLGFKNE
jgi:hypothetical protein